MKWKDIMHCHLLTCLQAKKKNHYTQVSAAILGVFFHGWCVCVM